MSTPNAVHQAHLLFLPHDTVGHGQDRKTYKYTLTVLDVASLFKEAETLSLKDSAKVRSDIKKIYKCRPLKWPQLLQVDHGHMFMGAVTKEIEKHKTNIRHGHMDIHRDQAIVDRFNCTLAKHLFGR